MLSSKSYYTNSEPRPSLTLKLRSISWLPNNFQSLPLECFSKVLRFIGSTGKEVQSYYSIQWEALDCILWDKIRGRVSLKLSEGEKNDWEDLQYYLP